MALALFDLDNTLLAGDSDYLWGCFLSDKGLVDKALYEQANLKFYEQYKQGTLDIHEFLNFALKPLAENDFKLLQAFHTEFMTTSIRPIMTKMGQGKINQHCKQGDTVVIITATNSFVTAPIANAFGVEHLIATELEIIDGQYTGNVSGTACFQQGKITKLKQWMQASNYNLDGSYFYSDSHNDLPLLEQVTHPIAVDPDDQLRAIAQLRGWEIISLRGDN